MEIQDQARALTTAFLDAHGERGIESLLQRLRQTGKTASLPVHRALFDLAGGCIREGDPRNPIADIRRILTGVDPPREMPPLLSGQIALWDILHRMLREVEGPHRNLDAIHVVLALVGDTLDGFLGALIDLASSGGVSSPGWGTLVELGRMHREFQALTRLTHHLLDARDPDQMFGALEEGILGTFHPRSLVIAAVGHEEGFVEVVRAYPTSPVTHAPVGWRYDLSHPEIFCEVARTGRAEVIDGWDPRYHERVVQPDGSVAFRQRPRAFNAGQTAFFFPILAGDRTVGVVATGSDQAGKQIILREIERMRPFLHQVGATLSGVSEILRRRRAEEELKKAHDALEQRVSERTAELSKANDLLQTQVAERRRAEEAVEERERRFRALIENSSDGINLLSADGIILFASPSITRILGYDIGEFVGRNAFEMMHPDDLPLTSGLFARLLKTPGATETAQFRYRRRDGAWRWLEGVGINLLRDPSVQAIVVNYRDISERRQAEEATREAERLMVLAQAAVGAAHEIFQPLTAVIGQAELVLSKIAPDDPKRKDLEAIIRAGYQISDIVNKMQTPRRYATRPYVKGVDMIDFDAAAQEEREDR